ncbi:MAG: cupin domain-containing protein [Gemmatimonadota bacterium]
MKHRNVAALSGVLLLAAAPALAQEPEKADEAATTTATATHLAVDAADLIWQPAPDALPAGAQVAVLAGDLTKAEPFVIRLKIPDGYRVAPHTHPALESVTVISGTLGIGMGETFDESAGTELGPGGLFVMQPETAHFAWATGEVIAQVHAIGPWALNYVNPADDPRNATPQEEAPAGR